MTDGNLSTVSQVDGVSVAIATYNGARYLPALIESIIAQSEHPLEIVCSDDGSSDGTPELLETIAETCPIPLKVIRQPRNLGIIENFLAAFAATRGEYIAYCDHDDVWRPGKIAACRAALDAKVHLVCQPSMITDADLTPTGEVYYAVPYDTRLTFPEVSVRKHAWGHQMVFSRASVVRLQALYKLPVFQNSEFGHCFDYGIPLAASLEGDLCFLAEPQTLFRRHASATSDAGLSKNALKTGLRDKIGARLGRLGWELEMIDTVLAVLDALPKESATGTKDVKEAYRAYRSLTQRRLALGNSSSMITRLLRLSGVASHYLSRSRKTSGWRQEMLADLATAFYGHRANIQKV